MTIALGIIAADGIVIAADTQETIGPTKTTGDKVIVGPSPDGVIAVTGAGSAGFLDAMAQQVIEDVFARRKQSVEAKVRESFGLFYAKHVVPLYEFDRFKDPDISAIIGIEWGKERLILANEQTTLRKCGRFVAVGAGQEQASMILSQNFIPNLPLKRAAVLAAYTIYCVKESVESCGKNTQVFMLSGGHCSSFWHWDQEELDKQFERYTSASMVLLHHVLGREGTPDDVLPVIEMTKAAIEKAIQDPKHLNPSKKPPTVPKRKNQGGR